jgi:hypothetical protein
VRTELPSVSPRERRSSRQSVFPWTMCATRQLSPHLLPIASTTNLPSSNRSRLLCAIILSRSLFRPKAVGLNDVLCYILPRTSQPIYRTCDGSYTRLYTPFRTSTIFPRTAWPECYTVSCDRSTASLSTVCPNCATVTASGRHGCRLTSRLSLSTL